jgi:hypothetical protein
MQSISSKAAAVSVSAIAATLRIPTPLKKAKVLVRSPSCHLVQLIRTPRLVEILLNFKNVFRFLQAKKLPTLLTRCRAVLFCCLKQLDIVKVYLLSF